MQSKISLLLCFIVMINISCNHSDEVIAEVESIYMTPWVRNGGHILKYKVKFERNGKIDSTVLIGNRIYEKGTDRIFFFEPGDSLVIKPGRLHHGLYQTNKFVKIHSLIPRNNKNTSVASSLSAAYSQYVVDIPALLPDAKDCEENIHLIEKIFREQLNNREIYIQEIISFYLEVDTLGKASLVAGGNLRPDVINALSDIAQRLPMFTPAEINGKKVNAGATYYIRPDNCIGVVK